MRKASAARRGSEGRGQSVVAVLRFINVAHLPELDELAAAIADDISRQISRAPGFRVIVQPAVVAAMQPNPDDLTQVARVLGARYLVAGSLRQPEAGCLRIAAQIVDGEKAQYLLSLQQDLAARGGSVDDDVVAGTAARIEQRLSLAEAASGDGDARNDRQHAWHRTFALARAIPCTALCMLPA